MKNLKAFLSLLRPFLSELSGYALVIASISSMLYFGFNFKLSILLILGLGITLFGLRLITLNYEFRLINQLENFINRYGEFKFTDTSMFEFMNKMYYEKFDSSEITEEHRQEYFRSLIPFSNRKLRRIKLIFIENTNNVLDSPPSSWVTYNFIAEPWIFVCTNQSKMNGIQKFQLLHEIGHAGVMGNSELIGSVRVNGFLLNFLCISIFMFSTDHFLIFLLATLVLLVLLKILYIRFDKSSEMLDEINADCFAFERAFPWWFTKYYDRYDSSEIAKIVCLSSEKEKKKGWIMQIFSLLDGLSKKRGGTKSKISNSSRTNYRIKLFAKNLERLKNGQDPIYKYPAKDLFIVKCLFYTNILLIVFWGFVGLTFKNVTLVELVILATLLFFIIIVGHIIHHTSRVLLLKLGDTIKVSEISENEKDFITDL